MSNPRALLAERARHDCTAHDWSETDAAQALIARYFQIEDAFLRVADLRLLDAQDALFNDMQNVEQELDALRDERIADEIAGLSEVDQEDDYLIEEINRSAPTVTSVIDGVRKTVSRAERLAA